MSIVTLALLFNGCTEQSSPAPTHKDSNDVAIEKVIRAQQTALSEQEASQLNKLKR